MILKQFFLVILEIVSVATRKNQANISTESHGHTRL